jgi:hypothetical protein
LREVAILLVKRSEARRCCQVLACCSSIPNPLSKLHYYLRDQ